jgi:hypothetical protein
MFQPPARPSPKTLAIVKAARSLHDEDARHFESRSFVLKPLPGAESKSARQC